MDSRWARWFIVALLFAAASINYIDRQTLSVLNHTLRGELNFSDAGYANVVTAFLVPYTIMYSAGGRLTDYLGARMGLALSLSWWSVATMLTALSRSVFSLGVFQFLLGVAEPCVYPAGIKSCAEWFPPKERALPTGIFSSGSAVGAVIAPPFVVWLVLRFSWRYAFFAPGLLGLCLVPLWLKAKGARAGTALAASPGSNTRWRQPGASFLARTVAEANGLGAGVAAFCKRSRMVFLPLLAPRLSPAGAAFQPARHGRLRMDSVSVRERRGRYRRRAVGLADSAWDSAGTRADGPADRSGLPHAAGRPCRPSQIGHHGDLPDMPGDFLTQCWSTNTGALAADLLPAASTGTVVGMMGTAGSLGGIVFAQVLGRVVGRFGYSAAFLLAGALHPIAALTLTLLLRGQKARPDGEEIPSGTFLV